MTEQGETAYILLIEDDKEEAEHYRNLLQKSLDAEVVVLSPPPPSLDELMILVREMPLSAIIIDERLPAASDAEYTGMDAADHIRLKYPNLPIIILTSYKNDQDLKEREDLIEWVWDKHEFDQQSNVYLARLRRRIRGEAIPVRGDQEDNIFDVISSLIQNGSLSAERITDELVSKIAEHNFRLDPSLELVVWFHPNQEKPLDIRLLEVNRTTIPTDSIDVFPFPSTEDFPFRMLLAEITPGELGKIKEGEIPLPEDWMFDRSTEYQRPDK